MHPLLRTTLSLAWCACALLSPLRATAQSYTVSLSIPDCEGISGAEIAKLVALELAPHFEITEESELRAAMRCSGARAEIRVDDVRRPEPLLLELSLSDARPEARPRLLALAIAELIATSRLEQPPDRKEVDKAAGARPPSAAEANTQLWLAAGVARELRPAAWAPVFALGAAHSFGLLQLAADVNFDFSARRTSAADLSARALSLALAPGLNFALHPVRLNLAAGVRAGWALLDASPRASELKGGSLSGLFLAPIAQLGAHWPLSPHWGVRLVFELGYVTKPVRGLDADNLRLLELSAWRGTGLLGVSFWP